MKLYNTLSRKKEEFVPIEEGKVKIYVCGPTVYDYFHIGNARPFIVFDVLRRYFEYKGYEVEFVQNFTDVDDKIIRKSMEEKRSSREVAESFIEAYYEDAEGLNVRKATVHPKVSENIDEIIKMIETLIEKGYAYNREGNVYYRVEQFKDYGKLSKQSLKDLESGARVEVSKEKENPLDFSLWKKKREGEPAWPSPWGEGRPGWHIECSAMSCKYLGETIDIHGGGQDLIFPHHENEIAQSEGAHDKAFANYWMHNGYINIDNEKMSKSKGNFFTVRDIKKHFDLKVVRFFMISAHYRSPVNFSKDLLEQAKSGLERLENGREAMDFSLSNQNFEQQGLTKEWEEELKTLRGDFEKAMDDDLNTADGVSVLFDLVKKTNVRMKEDPSKENIQAAADLYDELTGVLGIEQRVKGVLDEEIETLIEKRQQARKDKDFALADQIRDELKEQGIILEDTREGVQWKRI
ncbi:MAG TPA: cysteine--tRNA ligase [Eubacteriaceae bacterium]|nr:cysteine--tRNA ligase [Eubacteriaceae bacterium]